jgi:hypothetical protein
VGRASALLSRERTAALGALLALLLAYYNWRRQLPNVSFWWDVALLVFPIIPAVFALVWFVLPLWNARGLLLVAAAFAVLALATEHAGKLAIVGNFAKLGAMTALGWWFLTWFESLSWVVLVACLIPIVDSYSVWRGPTHEIIKHREHVFTTLSFAFPVPGEVGVARLGMPDLLFFALFVGAATRWRLRVNLTWALCALSFGGTIVIANLTNAGGLPALPLLSLGFLLANADLLWTRLRRDRGSPPTTPEGPRGSPEETLAPKS